MVVCVLLQQGCSDLANANHQKGLTTANVKRDQAFEKGANRPATAKTLYATADILATQGKDAEAESVLRKLINEYPRYLPAYNSLAELQMRQHRVKEAIETISRGLQINPKDPVLLNNLGMCWITRRNYQNALDMFTKACGVAPENTRYRANMATALALLGRDDEALALFQQVLPQDQANQNLAVIRAGRNKVNN